MRVTQNEQTRRRRGTTAVLVVATAPVLLGFAALTVDLGYICNVRANLQDAADAGSLAAAGALMYIGLDEDPAYVARQAAAEVVAMNEVFGRSLAIDPATDVVLGRANYDPDTNRYNFTPTNLVPDAVRVTVRCTEDSPNGPVPLFFAAIFGESITNVTASATAALGPRDMAMVGDLSGSMRDDSQLDLYDERTINLYDVWDALPGGALELDSTWAEDELPADLWQAAGPGWGFFKRLAFGTDPAASNYDPSTDPGLIRLPANTTWTDTELRNYLLGRGYSTGEADAITEPGAGDTYYKNRVAVATGLALWNSGIPGGLWESQEVNSADAGNSNSAIGSNELEWGEAVLSSSLEDSATIWMNYIDEMANSGPFQYRYGITTFVGYLIEKRYQPGQTPEFAGAPLQPLQATEEAVTYMVEMMEELGAADMLSLEVYDRWGRHEVDLTGEYQAVSDRYAQMHPGHYDVWTNIGAGLQQAIEELTGPRARAISGKVIVLLTDGHANRDENGIQSTSAAQAYALVQAEAAAELGIRIITVSVGQNADQGLMSQIAEIGNGVHFHAQGSIDDYSAQLASIFTLIGGMRSTQLIE